MLSGDHEPMKATIRPVLPAHISDFEGARVDLLFGRKTVVYIPAYNCQDTIVSVLRRIPAVPDGVIFLLDNKSSDSTAQKALEELRKTPASMPVVIVRSEENLGYAGSQKAAYGILRDLPSVERIIMLHGDGQYDPALIHRLVPLFDSKVDLAYGVRSKKDPMEETPWKTFLIIKVLSLIESLITGHFRKEWHSGFVMYSTRFLRRVDLGALTSTPHIDGNLLFIGGLLKADVRPVAIYKLYRELTAFEGAERRTYVINVFKLMWKFRSTSAEAVLRKSDISPRTGGVS